MKDQIWLIGFMATGKSRLARPLATALGWDALDLDTLIQQRTGDTITEIFEHGGEAAFRTVESEVIAEIAGRERIVVATGGGSILAEANRNAMRERGFIVCLEARPDTIHARIRMSSPNASDRPLLKNADPLTAIAALKEARQPLYAQADFIIQTDDMTPDQVTHQILTAFNEHTAVSATRPHMITVDSRAGRYTIHIQWNALDDLGTHMRDAGLTGAAYVVSDDAVGAIFGHRAEKSLQAAGFETALHMFPAGEANKNLDTVRGVYDWLLDHHAERGSTVVALGGGVVGDLAGFAASSYLRGVPLVQVPTSLLAMVDASIGGKTGVDHARGKNLIGAFYAPKLVLSDPSLLATLSPRALRDGFAEAIKHALIADPDMLDLLENDADRLLTLEPDLMVEFIARNAAIKANVVTQDEREGGLRMILNYGHTTAHAIEAVTGYTRVMHGEADSVGMMVAAEIGRHMGITPPPVGERQARVFEKYDLPLRMTGLDVAAVIGAMAYDKKVSSKTIRWILLEAEGAPVIRDDVPSDVVREVLREFLS